MIISFTVKNFKSIKEENTLDFFVENIDGVHSNNIAYPDNKKTIPVLRSTGIWGANASGKSNFWDALRHLQHFVEFSHQNDLDKPIREYQPFRLDRQSIEEPTFFELDFIGRDKEHYVYTVEFDRTRINYESLEFYASAKSSTLFKREIVNGKLAISFGSKLSGAKAFSCRENQSYLSVAGNTENSSKQIQDVLRFIRDDIVFMSNYISVFSPQMLENIRYLNALSVLMACADTGINQVLAKEDPASRDHILKNIPENLKQQFLSDFKFFPVFKHNNQTVDFSLQDESGGTQRLYHLAPMILMGINEGKTWIIDEIDSMLHPYILEMIIHLFHDLMVNANNPQLIFTTHCTSLLNSDIFRRDQIYFTRKDCNGVSELDCLDQYPVRSDANFEKWYREERFGAIPQIKYDELREVIASMKFNVENAGGKNA